MTLFIIYLISTVCGVKPSNLLPRAFSALIESMGIPKMMVI
ncbi:hypothetical protein [Gluconobacter wancherniae]|nr:hypothetical protein [Gluconobacter wancherniae]